MTKKDCYVLCAVYMVQNFSINTQLDDAIVDVLKQQFFSYENVPTNSKPEERYLRFKYPSLNNALAAKKKLKHLSFLKYVTVFPESEMDN